MKKRKELFENKDVEEVSSVLTAQDKNKEKLSKNLQTDQKSVGAETVDIDKILRGEKTSDDKTRYFRTDKASLSKTRNFTAQDHAPEFKPLREADESTQLIFAEYKDELAKLLDSEKEVEKELQKSRKNLIENFRVLSKNESDKAILEKNDMGAGAESVFDSVEVEKGETLFDAVERAGTKKEDSSKSAAKKKERREKRNLDIETARKRKQELLQSHKAYQRKTGILLAIFAVTLVFNLFASVYSKTEKPAALFQNGSRIFTAINLVLMLVSVIVSFDVFKKGIKAMKKSAVDINACVFVLNCFTALHSIVMLIIGMTAQSGIYNFTICSVFALLSVNFAEIIRTKCIYSDFSVMIRSKSLEGIGTVENKNEAAAIASGLSKKGEPKIVYPTDIDFQENYMETASSFSSHEKVYTRAGIAAVIAGFVFAVVIGILQKNAAVFPTGLAECVCLCAPFMRHLISIMLKLKNNKVFLVSGVVVSGYDCTKDVGKANAVIVDTDEVFVSSVSKFRTVPGSRVVRSDAVVYAAATLKKSRSILRDAFDDYLDSAGIALPEAEDLQYEDKLGYSCWVAGRRVLVGTREMLVQHSIPAPSEEEEKQYESSRSVLYVVVEGNIAATFVVSYNVRSEHKTVFRALNNSGLVLILNTGDPSLREEFVAKKLSADISAVKITSSKSSKIIERCKSRSAGKLQTGLIYPKAQRNALLLIYAAHNFYVSEKFAGIIHLAGLVLSFILLALFTILKISFFFAPITIVLLQLLWGAVSYLIGSIRIQ